MKLATPANRQGLTLVEVVASIALLGSLLVSMLYSHSRLTRQIQRAANVRLATNVADDLLADWFVNDSLPLNESGIVESSPNVRWSTNIVRAVGTSDVPAIVVNVSILVKEKTEWNVLFSTELLIEAPDA